jgi:hypothetical protein
MLDNETMTLLTKLKVAAKKSGTNVDLIKMSSDKEYAATILNELSNTEDADLVLIVVNLMNKFGMISAPKGDKKAEGPAEERYIGRLR